MSSPKKSSKISFRKKKLKTSDGRIQSSMKIKPTESEEQPRVWMRKTSTIETPVKKKHNGKKEPASFSQQDLVLSVRQRINNYGEPDVYFFDKGNRKDFTKVYSKFKNKVNLKIENKLLDTYNSKADTDARNSCADVKTKRRKSILNP